jgi:peptide/nickel transport system substrate-binding protein
MKFYSRRQFIGTTVAGGGAAVLLAACSGGGSNDGGERSGNGGDSRGLPDIEGGEVVDQIPSRFNERPEFAEMVAAGTLPPVEERIGSMPLVISPLDSTGTYGGTIRRAFNGVVDRQNATRFCTGPDNLLYWDYAQENVVPNIAAGYQMSDDFTELILHLREGMRWSDGEPFTADDIIFWREQINLNAELATPSEVLTVDGQPVRVERVDDLTVRFVSPAPHPLLPAMLAGWTDVGGQTAFGGGPGSTGGGGFAPAHYLSQFLPSHTSQAAVDRLAADAGFESWVAFFIAQSAFELNADLPIVAPWVVTRQANHPPWEFGPNPYSMWVDTEGNQLPYIGEITMELIETPDAIALRATSGGLDFQDRHLAVQELPVLLENERRGGYEVHQAPGQSMDCAVRLNLAYSDDPVIGDLLRTVEFRRALSLAVDRDQVNEAFFVGSSISSATSVPDDSPYFPGEEWRDRWATLDRDQATELLDGMGLEVDGSGNRLRPDGGGPIRLEIMVAGGFADYAGVAEMLGEQLSEIGIAINVEPVEGGLMGERVRANQQMMTIGSLTTENPWLLSEGFLPTSTRANSGAIGVPYVQWFRSGGAQGVEPPESLRLTEAMELYRQGFRVTEDERIEIGQELYRIHADQVWTIGICGFGLAIYGLYVANERLANVPARVLNNFHGKTPANALPMTFYYRD